MRKFVPRKTFQKDKQSKKYSERKHEQPFLFLPKGCAKKEIQRGEQNKMTFRYLPPEKREKAKRLLYESKLRSYKKHLNKERATNPYYTIRANLNLVRMNNRIGSQTNTLRWSSGETKEHILKKLEICMELKEWQHQFITEAIFQNGTRCDVLDLTEGTIYEILHTETEEKCENKIEKYPEELKIVKILCEKTL